MSEKKIIAVLGATGAQGGGLVRAILNDPKGGFAARAITRNANSDAAKALAAAGAEVVEANLEDPESIRKAFEGAYGAFCITFFWDHFSPDREIEEARMMATAAKAAGLKHVIWSTLEDTRKSVPLSDDRMPTLQDRFKVPHFDAKGEADHFFAEAGVPTTYLLTSFYWDNFIHFGMGPRRGEDGKLVLALPMADAKLPAIAAEDIGKSAYGVFKAGDKYIGQYVGISGGHPTGAEMAASFTKVLGEPVAYYAMPHNDYRGLGFPGADDLGNMFQFKCDFNDAYCGARDLDFGRQLNPEMQDFDTWLEAHKSHFASS